MPLVTGQPLGGCGLGVSEADPIHPKFARNLAHVGCASVNPIRCRRSPHQSPTTARALGVLVQAGYRGGGVRKRGDQHQQGVLNRAFRLTGTLKASVIRAPTRPALPRERKTDRPTDTSVDRSHSARPPNLRVRPGTCSAKVMRAQDSDRIDHLDRFHQHTLDRGKQQLVQLRRHFVHDEGLSTTPPSTQAVFGRTSVVVSGQRAHGWPAAHEPGSTRQAPLESIIQGTGRRSTAGPPRSVRRAVPRAAAGC